MRIPFACPSCAARGSVDASAAGREARCKHCGCRFTIPTPGEPEPVGYALEEPVVQSGAEQAVDAPPDSAFVSSRRERASAPRRPSKQRTTESPSRKVRKRVSPFPWGRWLTGFGVALAIILAAIILLVPSGKLIAGCVLMALGGLLVLVGYAAGAYGAFHEDFLYGFLYLVIPLYTAYYIVTRWEDLWVWFTCSTVGVGLAMLGIELARWGGIAA